MVRRTQKYLSTLKAIPVAEVTRTAEVRVENYGQVDLAKKTEQDANVYCSYVAGNLQDLIEFLYPSNSL